MFEKYVDKDQLPPKTNITEIPYENECLRLRDPVWKTENDQRLVDLTHQLRDAIWKTKGITDHPDDRFQDMRPEDLGLQLGNIPDNSSPSGHADNTVIIEDPRGGAPLIRPANHHVPAHKIPYSNNLPPDAFLIPFQYGFHREVVRSANGKNLTVYYYTENGVQLRTKKDVGPHIKYLQGITRDDFNFSGIILPLDDPTSQYQSVRPANASRRLTHQITHRESYQTTDDVETK